MCACVLVCMCVCVHVLMCACLYHTQCMSTCVSVCMCAFLHAPMCPMHAVHMRAGLLLLRLSIGSLGNVPMHKTWEGVHLHVSVTTSLQKARSRATDMCSFTILLLSM